MPMAIPWICTDVQIHHKDEPIYGDGRSPVTCRWWHMLAPHAIISRWQQTIAAGPYICGQGLMERKASQDPKHCREQVRPQKPSKVIALLYSLTYRFQGMRREQAGFLFRVHLRLGSRKFMCIFHDRSKTLRSKTAWVAEDSSERPRDALTWRSLYGSRKSQVCSLPGVSISTSHRYRRCRPFLATKAGLFRICQAFSSP